MFLEVLRGKTEFPRRPVLKRRFRIGAAEGCDLRLGSDEIPPLHSILDADGADVWIEAIAQTPPLRVNDQARPSSRLENGDVIEIGPFQLVVRRPFGGIEQVLAAASIPQRADLKQPERHPDMIPDEVDLETLSAADLVALLEQEEKMVEEFEQRRKTGAAALLHAALERVDESLGESLESAGELMNQLSLAAERPAAGGPATSEEPTILPFRPLSRATGELQQELQKILNRLDGYALELESRAPLLLGFEQRWYTETSSVLEQARRQLSRRLATLPMDELFPPAPNLDTVRHSA